MLWYPITFRDKIITFKNGIVVFYLFRRVKYVFNIKDVFYSPFIFNSIRGPPLSIQIENLN